MFVGVSRHSLTQNCLVIAVSKKIEYNYPVYKTKLLAFIVFIQETLDPSAIIRTPLMTKLIGEGENSCKMCQKECNLVLHLVTSVNSSK
jgi:hypothetical protein